MFNILSFVFILSFGLIFTQSSLLEVRPRLDDIWIQGEEKINYYNEFLQRKSIQLEAEIEAYAANTTFACPKAEYLGPLVCVERGRQLTFKPVDGKFDVKSIDVSKFPSKNFSTLKFIDFPDNANDVLIKNITMSFKKVVAQLVGIRELYFTNVDYFLIKSVIEVIDDKKANLIRFWFKSIPNLFDLNLIGDPSKYTSMYDFIVENSPSLTYISESFKFPPKLGEMSAPNNGIGHIHSQVFKNCSELMVVNLSNNNLGRAPKLEFHPKAPINQGNVNSDETYVDLSNNTITSIDELIPCDRVLYRLNDNRINCFGSIQSFMLAIPLNYRNSTDLDKRFGKCANVVKDINCYNWSSEVLVPNLKYDVWEANYNCFKNDRQHYKGSLDTRYLRADHCSIICKPNKQINANQDLNCASPVNTTKTCQDGRCTFPKFLL